MAADGDDGTKNQPDGLGVGQAHEIADLAARVAELERLVAELAPARQAEASTILHPVRRWNVPGWRPPVLPDRLMPAALRVDDAAGGAALPPPLPESAAVAAVPERSLESRLGAQAFNMIGIVAILFGAAWFLKLAIERGWVGPMARVVVGLAAGAGVVLWSETFRRKGMKAFSYSLKAVGSSLLYLSIWAAFQLYHLLPAGVALGVMVLVTAWNGFMAWSQDAELLAAYGLVGGFATPLLLSTGGDHETFLFTYVAAIDVATVLLMRRKPWTRLLLPAFGATSGYFIGYYAEFFHRSAGAVWDGQSTETAVFALLFAALFAIVPVRGFRRQQAGAHEVVAPVLLPLAGAAFVSLALYSVMEDSGLHSSLAWLMVALAGLYLGLMRVQASAMSRAIHLTSAVVFLTIAIPLKASGHTLTTAWLVEGLVLYWAAARFEKTEGGDALSPARVLWVLSLAGYSLGLLSLAFHWLWMRGDVRFFNADLGSSLVAVAALAGGAWLAAGNAEDEGRANPLTLLALLAPVDFVAVLLALREIAVSRFSDWHHAAFANAEFATAGVGLAVLAGVSSAAYRLAQRAEPLFAGCNVLSGVTLVLFNLLAILSVEREIGALWTREAANLQRSLAISGFLMAYGAALLAAGFWRRSAFVRWQALILLLFTIAKVFFYDVSGLSQGYRVASFLGLGALLMGVSFAYQKDWLGLRAVAAADMPGERS